MKERKQVSELRGADEGIFSIGADSATYVNTGFPGLNTRGPVRHNKYMFNYLIILRLFQLGSPILQNMALKLTLSCMFLGPVLKY